MCPKLNIYKTMYYMSALYLSTVFVDLIPTFQKKNKDYAFSLIGKITVQTDNVLPLWRQGSFPPREKSMVSDGESCLVFFL